MKSFNQLVEKFLEDLAARHKELDENELKKEYYIFTKQSAKVKLLANSKEQNKEKKCSSWINFCSTHRATMSEKHPNKKLTEITKLLGQTWKEMSQEEKEKYNS